MYNLIKSDFYKLRHSKAFKNSLIIIIFIIAWNMKLYFTNSNKIYIFHDSLNNKEVGFTINNFINRNNPKVMEFFNTAIGFIPVVQIVIISLVVVFVINEYYNGTIKNIVSYGHKRIYIYMSKLIVSSLSIFIILFILTFGQVAMGIIFTKCSVNSCEIIKMIKMLITIWLVFTAMSSIYILFSVIIRNKSVVISIGILSMFLCLIYIKFICNLLNNYYKYIPTYMLIDIPNIYSNSSAIGLLVSNSIIVILITSVIGIVVFERQDIK